MPRLIATAAFLLAASLPCMAEVGCTPYCDFTHYYGPQDFTYVRPGLFLYPVCGPSGDCSPYLIRSTQRYRGTVTVRRVVRPVRRPQ